MKFLLHCLELSRLIRRIHFLINTICSATAGSFRPSSLLFRYNNNIIRILEHLGLLTTIQIPQSCAARYGEKIVAAIARTAKNEDVRFLAVASLINWPNYDEVYITTVLFFVRVFIIYFRGTN